VQPRESEWIVRFASHLKHERRMSAHTLAAYLADIAQLVVFCDARKIASFSSIDTSQVRSFAAAAHAQGLAARSIQRRLSALRTFFEFLMREGASTRNPAVDVRAPKQKKRLPTTLDADQMGRLLAFRTDDTLSARDKAVMELFYSSGLRLAELVSLDVTSIDLKDRTVRVLGKGAKSRVLPIGRYAIAALERWLAERSALLVKATAGTQPGAVFVGRSGRRLSARAVQLRVDLWARRTCSAIPSRRTCSSRAAICAGFRSFSGTPTSPPRRSTPTWISSTSPRSTTRPTRERAAAAPGTGAPGVATLETAPARPQ